MNREERERLVDGVLDRVLGPQLVEPRSGLEERLLANLAAQPERRPWWRWIWSPALAMAVVATIVVVAVALYFSSHRVAPATPQLVQQQSPKVERRDVEARKDVEQAPVQSIARTRKHPRARIANRGTSEAASVQRPMPGKPFPAVAPLTEAERALFAMLQQNPDERQLLLQRQEQARQQADQFFQSFNVQQ